MYRSSELLDDAMMLDENDLFYTHNGMPLTKEQMDFALYKKWVHPRFRDGIITVDKMLDCSDVKLEWYIPSSDAIEFFNFIRLALGSEPENTNPKAHYFLIDAIFQSETVKPYFVVRNIDYEMNKNRLVVLATREFAKSTLLGSMLPLYMAYKGYIPNLGKTNFGIYVGDSMTNNVKTTMETIGSVYRESPFLRSAFEDSRTNQDEVSFVRKPRTKKEIELYNDFVGKQNLKPKDVPLRMERTFTMKGVGASSGARGSRDALSRPKFAFFDDLIGNEKDATSDAILSSIESTIESDIIPALHSSNNLAIVIGTPYNKKDPVYRRIESGLWLPIVFPKADFINENVTKSTFRGVWEDRHTYRSCIADYKRAKKASDNGDPLPMRSLMQEYYLRISSEEDRMINESYIQWFPRDDIVKNAYSLNWYITTDYTTTGSKGSDYSCIMLWAVDSEQNHFLVDLVLRKIEVDEQYNRTFDLAMFTSGIARWVEVGVEIDGQQTLHINGLRDRMPKKNFFFSFARQKGAKIGSEGIRSRLEGGNKHWRFRMTLPLWQNRKIWFAKELKHTPDMSELLDEIRYVTFTGFGSKHDDGCDGISQLIMMDISYPSKELIGENQTYIGSDGEVYRNVGFYDEDEDNEDTAYDSYA